MNLWQRFRCKIGWHYWCEMDEGYLGMNIMCSRCLKEDVRMPKW